MLNIDKGSLIRLESKWYEKTYENAEMIVVFLEEYEDYYSKTNTIIKFLNKNIISATFTSEWYIEVLC